LKWLLSERAAIAGQINKAVVRSQALRTKLASLQIALERTIQNIQATSNFQVERQATLEALDTTIGIAYREVRSDAAGVVNAWAGKYGQRGGLKAFVEQALKDASPAPVNVRHLTTRVASHFQIGVATTVDRLALGKSVKSVMSVLAEQGLVYPLHSRQGNQPGIWCWKQPATLADLAVRAAAIAKAAADAPSRQAAGGSDAPHAHAP
jgi:hypothetical protein